MTFALALNTSNAMKKDGPVYFEVLLIINLVRRSVREWKRSFIIIRDIVR